MKIAFLGNAHIHTQDYARACLADPRATIVGAACVEQTPYDFPSGVPVFDTPENLPDHDLCVVTSDIAAHTDLVGQARAPHIFIEKPIGINAAAARDVAEALRASGAVFRTGLFLRHGTPVKELRAALRNGMIGAVREMDLTYAHHGVTAGWLRDWSAHLDMSRMGYGVFGDLAAHLIDLAGWCLGPLRPETCELTTEAGTDIAGTGLLRAPDDVPVRVTAGALAAGRDLTLRVSGTSGTLSILDDALVLERPGAPPERLTAPDDLTPGAGFRYELDTVADGRSSGGATLDEAIAVNETLDALYALVTRKAASTDDASDAAAER